MCDCPLMCYRADWSDGCDTSNKFFLSAARTLTEVLNFLFLFVRIRASSGFYYKHGSANRIYRIQLISWGHWWSGKQWKLVGEGALSSKAIMKNGQPCSLPLSD